MHGKSEGVDDHHNEKQFVVAPAPGTRDDAPNQYSQRGGLAAPP
jgi:hypothetical protein